MTTSFLILYSEFRVFMDRTVNSTLKIAGTFFVGNLKRFKITSDHFPPMRNRKWVITDRRYSGVLRPSQFISRRVSSMWKTVWTILVENFIIFKISSGHISSRSNRKWDIDEYVRTIIARSSYGFINVKCLDVMIYNQFRSLITSPIRYVFVFYFNFIITSGYGWFEWVTRRSSLKFLSSSIAENGVRATRAVYRARIRELMV